MDTEFKVSPGQLCADGQQAPEPVLAIAASTGGTEAIAEILAPLPSSFPAIVLVQHIPRAFTRPFVRHLDERVKLQVSEAGHGDPVDSGCVKVAPGGRHMRLQRVCGRYRVCIEAGSRVSGHCPSADVLLESVARYAGTAAAGLILTGMGHDGARGLRAMREAGAPTWAQDESSCAVFGMPAAALHSGAVIELLPLAHISARLLQWFDLVAANRQAAPARLQERFV